MASQSGQFLPTLSAVGRAKERRIFNTCVDGLGIGERRLEVPDAGELPRMLCAVIPLVRPCHAVVGKLVPHGFPTLSAVVGSLDHLTEPAAALRGIQAVRIERRAF